MSWVRRSSMNSSSQQGREADADEAHEPDGYIEASGPSGSGPVTTGMPAPTQSLKEPG